MSLLMNLVVLASLVVCPAPKQASLSETEYHPLERVVVSCSDPDAVQWAERHLTEWYGDFSPKVEKGPSSNFPDGKEEYSLQIGKNGVRVKASTLQGIRYGLYSLRQLAIPKRGTATVQGWIVPAGEIHDEPTMGFRGIHICWFRENEVWEIERFIRLAAYYKLNYAVIEPWGTYEFNSAPWLSWPDVRMTKEEVHRLKAIADDLGVTLIPQFNMFGHASQARSGASKHAVLDFSPEYQPLFEPEGGWTWCLSNPETRKLLLSVIDEMMEDFGNPPYFHIGFDEAEAPSCPECLKRPYSQLFLSHIEAIAGELHKRGATPMMWHDMLLEGGDPRWKGFYASGTEDTSAAAAAIPGDIVICDWYYDNPMESYPTLEYFKSIGHPVLTCPWLNVNGMKAQASAVSRYGLDGMLGTLWHHYFGYDMENVFHYLSGCTWNPDNVPDLRRLVFATHLRQIGWDMENTDPVHAGTRHFDIAPQPGF